MKLKELGYLYRDIMSEVRRNNVLAARYSAKFDSLDRLRQGGGYSPLQEFYQVICQFHLRQALLLEHELHVIADLPDDALKVYDRPVQLAKIADMPKGGDWLKVGIRQPRGCNRF